MRSICPFNPSLEIQYINVSCSSLMVSCHLSILLLRFFYVDFIVWPLTLTVTFNPSLEIRACAQPFTALRLIVSLSILLLRFTTLISCTALSTSQTFNPSLEIPTQRGIVHALEIMEDFQSFS